MTVDQYIVENLAYSDDGSLWWKSKGQGRDTSSPAGFNGGNGYVYVKALGKSYRAHRVVWLLANGQWPDGEIDHIDGNKKNNRIENLRIVTRAQNIMNTPKRRGTRSKFRGVYWHEKSKKWRAMISCGGKLRSLGLFESECEAASAYDAAAASMRGEFAVLNRSMA